MNLFVYFRYMYNDRKHPQLYNYLRVSWQLNTVNEKLKPIPSHKTNSQWQFITGSRFKPRADSLEASVHTSRPSCRPVQYNWVDILYMSDAVLFLHLVLHLHLKPFFFFQTFSEVPMVSLCQLFHQLNYLSGFGIPLPWGLSCVYIGLGFQDSRLNLWTDCTQWHTKLLTFSPCAVFFQSF